MMEGNKGSFTPESANEDMDVWALSNYPKERMQSADSMAEAVDVQMNYLSAIVDTDLARHPSVEELRWAINDLRWLIAQERNDTPAPDPDAD